MIVSQPYSFLSSLISVTFPLSISNNKIDFCASLLVDLPHPSSMLVIPIDVLSLGHHLSLYFIHINYHYWSLSPVNLLKLLKWLLVSSSSIVVEFLSTDIIDLPYCWTLLRDVSYSKVPNFLKYDDAPTSNLYLHNPYRYHIIGFPIYATSKHSIFV